MIGDLLVKLNRGERLLPAEEETLRLWGNQVSLNNAFIGGIQNGTSDINVSKINAISGEYRYAPTGYTSKVRTTGNTSVPNNTETNLVFGNYYYDELRCFAGNGADYIDIQQTGKYRFVIYIRLYSLPAPTSGWGRIILWGGGGQLTENAIFALSSSTSTTAQLVGEVSVSSGSQMAVGVKQTSGGTMVASGSITITLIRNYDSEFAAT